MITAQEKPVQVTFTYKPLPKQEEFHGNNAKYRFFGGGFGNGKTSAGCFEALMLALEYPGSTGVIARKTRPELRSTTQDVFFNGGGGDPERGDYTGCPQELIRKFNKTDNRLELINGSVIYFWPLDESDKLKNINLGWFLIDQAEEVAEDMFQMLQGRLRQRGAPRKGMVLFNPAGHDWIWRRCVYLEYPDHALIHAKTTDNPNLPPDYIDALMQYPEAWRKRFMEGSFDVFSGQIYPEFDEDVHTINPFIIPNWYEKVEGIDHGRRVPTAVEWAAFDEQGNCFIIDEHYEAGKLVSHHAQQILKKREESWGHPNYTVIDASAAALDPNTGRSVIDEYFDWGISTIPSDRHVIARVNRIAEWLRLDPDHPHPLTGETRPEGWPKLYIFKNCHNLVEHLQQYQWKPQPPTRTEDPKEKPLEKDDHDVDALGYILMTRPPPATKPIPRGPRSRVEQIIRDRIEQRTRGGPEHSMLGSEV
jgi:PBSX family phage terminase large subunit